MRGFTLAIAVLIAGQAIAVDSAFLIVTGQIDKADPGCEPAPCARFDEARLGALPQQSLTVDIPVWLAGKQQFSGPTMLSVLDAVGARGKHVEFVALNRYKVTIPSSDFADMPVILARRQNGKLLSIRQRGPLWLMYPFAERTPISTAIEPIRQKSIWQVVQVRVLP
ncbi:molybdopterin-dependent oxidoreductase [Parachitinimonas caeni]|uniref:Molybdopterin-dependent oxidoreductase n=1 Tax=Parachitinimonas caeni TaxID=3031301 RepID=A0ABT7E2E4_9NEIS|nr:molybdopterin-dependent oxidoreductase [Parachitinimonas caeni]MDK2126486.1 molybdopterin-dependent oxidoreductase [Parachitinimonas caeni]